MAIVKVLNPDPGMNRENWAISIQEDEGSSPNIFFAQNHNHAISMKTAIGSILSADPTPAPTESFIRNSAATTINRIKSELYSSIASTSGYILLIAGPMGSGKDRVGSELANLLTQSPNHTHTLGISNEIRSELLDVFSALKDLQDYAKTLSYLKNVWKLSGPKVETFLETIVENTPHGFQHYDLNSSPITSRRLLQTWAMIRRDEDPDCFLVKTFVKAIKMAQDGNTVLITGARFPNELDTANALGFLTVRLDISPSAQIKRLEKRDGIPPTKEALAHLSEHALDNYNNYTVRIDNSVTRSPKKVAREIKFLLEQKNLLRVH
jgi:shikimate kinase